MKTTITIALAAALALAAPLTAQTADELWQQLVEAEVALTIEKDVDRASQLLADVSATVDRVADDARRTEIDTRLFELTSALRAARERRSVGPSLRDWLLQHLHKRDFTTIRDAGSSASRSIADMLAERAYPSPDVESSAIDALIYADPGAGVALAQLLVERGAPGDTNLAARLVIGYVGSDSVVEMRDGSRRWADPRWRDLLVALLADPELPRDTDAATTVGQAVERTIVFRIIDDLLVDAVIEALPRLPEQSARLTGRSVRTTPDVMAAIDAAMIRIGSSDDAAFAAERLALRDDATPLAEHDRHADARVRREVARSLSTRRLSNNVTLMPPYTKRQREALVRLTADEDVTTRALATRGATGAPDALTRERWLDLARDPALDVRIEVAAFPFGHAWTRDVLVTVIDASGEPAVASAVDERLRTAQGVVPPDVIDARLHHRSQPVSAVSSHSLDRIRGLFWRDAIAFVDWYLAGDEDRAKRYADVAAMAKPGVPSDDRLARLQSRVWTVTDGRISVVNDRLHELPRVALELALDATLPWEYRWRAVEALHSQNVQTSANGISNFSSAVSASERASLWSAIVRDPGSAVNASGSVSWLLRGTEANALILDAWTNEGPPDHPLLAASLTVYADDPRAVELAERIIAVGDGVAPHVRLAAILTLVQAGAASDELVDEALLAPHADGDLDPVFAWIAAQDDPGRLASVRALLAGDAPQVGPSTDSRTIQLVDQLGWSGTRRALDLLLDTAQTGPTLSIRVRALERATAIRKHLDAVAAFEADGAAPATRESARTELVRLLDEGTPAQRAEAARGLASLGAIEELPRLIRLLDDDHDEVRTAVREALDRLHASSDA